MGAHWGWWLSVACPGGGWSIGASQGSVWVMWTHPGWSPPRWQLGHGEKEEAAKGSPAPPSHATLLWHIASVVGPSGFSASRLVVCCIHIPATSGFFHTQPTPVLLPDLSCKPQVSSPAPARRRVLSQAGACRLVALSMESLFCLPQTRCYTLL